MQGAGPVSVSADSVVLAPLGDLLAVFEPVDLWRKIGKSRQNYQDQLGFNRLTVIPKPVDNRKRRLLLLPKLCIFHFKQKRILIFNLL